MSPRPPGSNNRRIRFGLALKNFTIPGEPADAEGLLRMASQAESLGFDSVWVWDHILLGSRRAFPVLESLTMLAALAVATKRVELGTAVLVLSLRNPILLAKATSTLDVLSNGRLTLGVAAGWYLREFAAVGIDHHRRGMVFLRNLELLERLWREDDISGEVAGYRLDHVTMLPHPVQQPRPRLLIGGYVDAVLKRVAERSDGWLNYFYTADSFRRSWKRVLSFAQDAGRDPNELDNVSELPICVGDSFAQASKAASSFIDAYFDIPSWSDCSPQSAVCGTPDECVEQLLEHVDAGVKHFVFVPADYDPEQVHRIATEVVPRMRSLCD